MARPPVLSARDAALLARGSRGRIYLAGATGEPSAVLDAVAAEPDLWQGLPLTGAFIPGVNERDYSGLGRGTRVETIFTTAALGAGRGTVAHLPMHYSTYWRHLATPGTVETAFVTVAPPRPDGTVGLGLAADFTPAAVASGARLVGIVNPRMPDSGTAPRLPLDRFAALVDSDAPLPVHAPGPADAAQQAIARHVVARLRPGDTLQLGLGKLQLAILAALADVGLRGLRFHAGMISPPVLACLEAGAFDRPATAGVALGDPAFYAALAGRDDIRFTPVGETHDQARLAATPCFVSVNSVIEVDLLGQANAEWAGGRMVSGQGGLVDFQRGARASAGGRAILALPATAGAGRASRIVPQLGPGTPVTVARADIDLVVTEHGVAELAGAALPERAERLIAIAAPDHRDTLRRAWST